MERLVTPQTHTGCWCQRTLPYAHKKKEKWPTASEIRRRELRGHRSFAAMPSIAGGVSPGRVEQEKKKKKKNP